MSVIIILAKIQVTHCKRLQKPPHASKHWGYDLCVLKWWLKTADVCLQMTNLNKRGKSPSEIGVCTSSHSDTLHMIITVGLLPTRLDNQSSGCKTYLSGDHWYKPSTFKANINSLTWRLKKIRYRCSSLTTFLLVVF